MYKNTLHKHWMLLEQKNRKIIASLLIPMTNNILLTQPAEGSKVSLFTGLSTGLRIPRTVGKKQIFQLTNHNRSLLWDRKSHLPPAVPGRVRVGPFLMFSNSSVLSFLFYLFFWMKWLKFIAWQLSANGFSEFLETKNALYLAVIWLIL